jgi:hypothetical protein
MAPASDASLGELQLQFPFFLPIGLGLLYKPANKPANQQTSQPPATSQLQRLLFVQ